MTADVFWGLLGFTLALHIVLCAWLSMDLPADMSMHRKQRLSDDARPATPRPPSCEITVERVAAVLKRGREEEQDDDDDSDFHIVSNT